MIDFEIKATQLYKPSNAVVPKMEYSSRLRFSIV